MKRLAALLIGSALATASFAGRYDLTKDNGGEVCRAYQQNFEPRHDKEPMACERQYDSAIPGFASVPWRPIDLKQNFTLYQEAEIFLATNGPGMVLSEKEAQEMAKDLTGKAEHLQTALYVAMLDIFGSGHPVNVLDVRELGCGPIPKPDVKISRLFVLNSKANHIDRHQQDKLEGWGNNATIELYDGKPYVEAYASDDNWGRLFTSAGRLSVATYNGAHFEIVCEVQYDPS